MWGLMIAMLALCGLVYFLDGTPLGDAMMNNLVKYSDRKDT